MVKLTARVYGRHDGQTRHRQRESFFPSRTYDFEEFTLEERNSDLTGTNDYTELAITAIDEAECERILQGQISDGVFENCATGRVEIVKIEEA